MALRYKEFEFFSDVDNLEIHCMAVVPDKEIKGAIQIVHGMCEHKVRYYEFMEYLASKGYLCVIHDHRGHGESVECEEDLGYFYSGGHEAMVEDIHKVLSLVKPYVEGKPYYLIGHSMGSMASRVFLKKYDHEIDKLVLLGSPSKPLGTKAAFEGAKVLRKLFGGHRHSKFFDYMVINSIYEKKYKHEGLLHSWISSDKEVVKKYNSDPLCNFTFTVDGYLDLMALMLETYDGKGWQLKNPMLPILFVSGKDDPCHIEPEKFGKSVHMMKKVGYENVKARLYGSMRHEVLNEKSKKRVYRDIYNFLQQGND